MFVGKIIHATDKALEKKKKNQTSPEPKFIS